MTTTPGLTQDDRIKGEDDRSVAGNTETSSMDSDAAIDIQLLCGAGVAATRDYLTALDDPAAVSAKRRTAPLGMTTTEPRASSGAE